MWTLRRRAARVVLLDAEGRVLLLRAVDPADPGKGEWWELPGGGVEHGESSASAAARELFEETGIEDAEMGGCVWEHRAQYSFGGYRFDQQEHIHVARLSYTTSADSYRPGGLEGIEMLAFRGMRWWDASELRDHQAGGGVLIPPWLPGELAQFLAEGHPESPKDLGLLGDVFSDQRSL